MSLPSGFNYIATSRAIDVNGNVQAPMAIAYTDPVRPTSTITSTSSTVITGTANDNIQLDRVELAIRNTAPQFWNGSALVNGYRRVSVSPQSNGNWAYNFGSELPLGQYYVTAIAFDTAGNAQQPFTTKGFTVTIEDSIRPTSTISTATGTAINGTAADNIAVASVQLAIRNTNLQYWNGTGMGGAYNRVPATLSQNGTSWSYNISGSLPLGSYVVTSIAFDAAGNVQSPYANKSFVVTVPDNAKPTTQITSPTSGSTLTQSPVLINGVANDDVAVARVELAIRNHYAETFWNGSSWQPSYVRVTANATNPGASSTSWSYSLQPELGTLLGITSFAFDTAGKASAPTSINAGVKLKIMALGDSITEGISGQMSYRMPLTTELDLTGCVYEMVGTKTQNLTNTGFISSHAGYSGHSTQYFLDHTAYPNAQNPGIDFIINNSNPDVVLVHLGSNDMNRSDSISGTVAELDSLASRIWSINSDTQIYVANVIPWYGNSNNSNIASDVATLGNQIESWINSQGDSRLHNVDVKSGYSTSYMISDGIHPNALGDAHIADAFLASMANESLCP